MRSSADGLDAAHAAVAAQAADLLEQAVRWLLDEGAKDAALPGAAAVNALYLFGIAIGAWQSAVAASRAPSEAKHAMARFYADQIFPEARARREGIAGSADVLNLRAEFFD
jgi:hypothetical protein